jgi:tetratricopeptide (TPR) repeat protein
MIRKVLQPTALTAKAQLKQALAVHESGQIPRAISLYEQIIKLAPGLAEAYELLGVAQSQAGHHEAGLKNIRKALQLNPQLGPAKTNLGHALMHAGKLSAAADQFKAVIAENPLDERAYSGLAQALIGANRIDEAISFIDVAATRFPRSATFLNERGRIASMLGKHKIAAEDYRRAFQINPNFHTAAINLGNALSEMRQYSEAEDVLSRIYKTAPRNFQVARSLANVYRHLRRTEDALAVIQTALSFAPNDPALLTLVGQCLTDIGKTDEAETAFRKVIANGVDFHEAIAGLVPIYKFKPADPVLAAVDKLLATSANRPDRRKSLLFAKAKILDDIGQTDAAVAAAVEAKSILPPPVSFESHAAFIRSVLHQLGAEFFANWRVSGSSTEQPVFILGMPRSGTTLTEQIIASHSRADGAGELTTLTELRKAVGFDGKNAEQFAKQLESTSKSQFDSLADSYLSVLRQGRKPEALRITDKLPHNFQNIWLIALLFPNARIIHCRRNAVDVCMSIFLRNFSDDHWYTRDLETLGKFYKLYEEQVAHWKAVTGLKWYDNDYEQLVADPEPNIRRMIDFLGLPWDEKCLSHTETERSVMTFSRWQVRQPIYQTSVEKWRKYAPYIGPLLKELGVSAS